MSVRIYQLSKEIGMENGDLIALLRNRGYEVKSASSTVDNISADSLREEFAGQAVAEVGDAPSAVSEPQPVEEKKPELPSGGAIVRTRGEIEKERAEREAEEERRRAELSAPKAPPAPPPAPPLAGRTPPALPKMPAPMAPPRVPSTPQQGQSGHSAPSPAVPPRMPIIRSDLPKQPPASPFPASGKGRGPAVPPPAVRPQANKPSTPVPPSPSVVTPKVPAPAVPSRVPAPSIPPRPETQDPATDSEAEAQPAVAADLRPLVVRTPIVVRDFAIQVGRRPFQLISELMEMSIFAAMNTAIEPEIAERVARNHGYALEVRHRGGAGQNQPVAKEEAKPIDDAALQVERPPVVCILGHVDHGKTTLLDSIRKANVVATEAGGITQHIGAYQITHNDKLITFIDTPGHAAFSNMRARGARTTDIAVLVVAADDGFMPQTDEALSHARNSKVPVVVAINKMDAPGANPDKVIRQLQERGLTPEELGGETLSARVSALKGKGIEDLLDIILLQAEVTEGIKANPNGNVRGVILEAQKELGRGSTASVIIQQGTLKAGTALVCGEYYCRVRQIIDDKGQVTKSAEPAQPVKLVGWSGPPSAGDVFEEVKNEREAKRLAEENELRRKKLEAAEVKEGGASIDDLFAAIERTQKKSYRVLVKADVYGTAEALATSLMGIKSTKIDLEVVDMGVGDVTRNDINMASASGANMIAFNVGMENGIQSVAKHKGVRIIQHNIIYELINQVKDAMADLLEPELRENKIGAAEVRQLFPLGKHMVAGCMVTEGRIQRDALARLMRGGKMVHQSKISTLKRFKDDVNEVRAGYECGIQIDGNVTYQERDSIEVFEILKIKPEL